ncbi:HAD family hydrolase [Bradyrhizobium sp. BWA-3-5]|uniref:HAD family hydrolase n=1 Tax=Bradyrhizobium sp. BWA-3-5 TaxID=3080013 RepID=UPI00397D8284
MRYLALITDGTLATGGSVSEATAAAVQRLRASGRHVILATGRRLDDLLTICPFIEAFSYVVLRTELWRMSRVAEKPHCWPNHCLIGLSRPSKMQRSRLKLEP